MTQVHVSERFTPGWPRTDAPQIWTVELQAALDSVHRFDAHFTAYVSPLNQRLTSGAADRASMVLAVFDVDAPAHTASADWFASELPKVTAVTTAHPGAWVYRTRGGYRLIWELPAPISPKADGGWWRRYRAWVAYLASSFQIEADPACSDWTRLFRLPLVVRDGVPTTDRANRVGVGVWAPPVSLPPVVERAAPLASSPRPEAWAAVYALHCANPPTDDRNRHSMAFAAAAACLGVSEDEATAALEHVLELSGADPRHQRNAAELTARTFERVEDGEPVTWCPPLWRGRPLEAELVRAWRVGLDAAPAPAAPAEAAPPLATTDGWTLGAGDLTGAPRDVERAIRAWRGRRDPGVAPEMKSSRAVIRWLVEFQKWTPEAVGAELGPQAVVVAREFVPTAPDVATIGRLGLVDDMLSPLQLRFNELKLAIEIDGRDWTDTDTAFYRMLAEQRGISAADKPVPKGDIEERALSRAKANAYHPVRDFLRPLKWDGVPRLDTMWVRYFGAPASPLHHALGACFGIGAVRRAMQPGCKVDMMPILYGAQGLYKSTGLKTLTGAEFFTDASPQFGHRSENVMTLTGCWIWEMAELEAFDRTEQNQIKAFVTRTEDHVLLPYARVKTRHPRHSVMIGTTNQQHCLKDPTGSRRHPVIPVGTIDLDGLTRDREQLWAEALHRAQTVEPHWLSREFEAIAAEQNEDFQAHDETVEEAIQTWLALAPALRVSPTRTDKSWFTISDVCSYALRVPVERQADRGLQTRVGAALGRLGFKGERVRMQTGRLTVFRFPA